MKLKISFVLLLLVPFALFFTSCENEIPEEFLIIAPSSPDTYCLEDVDYFEIWVNKVPEGGEDYSGQQIFPMGQEITYIPPVFEGRLYKGDVLRLGDLEPGKYELFGRAKKYFAETDYLGTIGEVRGISDKMETVITGSERNPTINNYLIIDEFSPTVVKLVVSFYANGD